MHSSPRIWLIIWALIVAAQALLTPVHEDEAYYWMYAQQLDWGYFDHPPLAALFIWLSGKVASGILGVRLTSILAHVGAVTLIWHTLPPETRRDRLTVFGLLFASLPLFHIFSFVTTPDAPLILTSAWFFFQYRKVVDRGDWGDYLLWGASMAAMMYAKYHGVLLVFFVLASNLGLLLKPRFYAAALAGLTLFFPHLLWQYQHDWASIRFHLQERKYESLWYHPLEFWGNVLVIFNPALAPFLYRALVRRPLARYERGLWAVLVGFLGFFFFQTFRDHVQPQWLVVTYIPFLLLSVGNITEKQTRYLKKSMWFTVPVLLAAHVLFTFDLLHDTLGVHRKKAFCEQVHAAAQGQPVMFMGSYQNASLYGYYQNEPLTHSYGHLFYRKTQYNFWLNDTAYHHRKTFVVGRWDAIPQRDYGQFWGGSVDFNAIENVEWANPSLQLNGDSVSVNATLFSAYAFPVDLGKDAARPHLIFFKENRMVGNPLPVELHTQYRLEPGLSVSIAFTIALPPECRDADAYGLSLGRHPMPAATIRQKFPM